MKNMSFPVAFSLYERKLISREEFIKHLKSQKITDEQAIALYDAGVWVKADVNAHFGLSR
jgi:hypothetical protein